MIAHLAALLREAGMARQMTGRLFRFRVGDGRREGTAQTSPQASRAGRGQSDEVADRERAKLIVEAAPAAERRSAGPRRIDAALDARE